MKNTNIHEAFNKKLQEAAKLHAEKKFESPDFDFNTFEKEYKKSRKKQAARIMGIVVVVAMIFGICFGTGVNTSDAFAETVSEIPVLSGLAKIFTIEERHEENSVYAVDVKIPAVEGLEDKALEERINALVQTEIDQVVAETKENMKADKEKWLRLGGKEEEYIHREIMVDYEVYTITEDILSFAVFKTETAASGYFDYIYYNYDLKTGEELTIKDLLGEDWQAIANAQIMAEIEERSKVEGADFNDGEDGFTGVTEEQAFYVNAKGNPVIVFNKYEIAPGYMGVQEFEVKR